MGKIVDVEEVQRELNRAARDAKHGSADVRAGSFVHGNARGDRTSDTDRQLASRTPSNAGQHRNNKPAR